MDEFPCEAGHDHVTPFDQFLYGNRPCMEEQPPAVGVTDEMVMRLKHALPLFCADVTMADARAALEAALAAQENPNG